MALVGWNPAQKLALTIDNSKVDEDLIDFPINIALTSNTGIGGFDAVDIFDKLSYADRHHIVVTDSNDNKLYTEIAYWDSINEKASLWTKVPTVSSGTDTDLYLYYDAAATTASGYTNDTGTIQAKAV